MEMIIFIITALLVLLGLISNYYIASSLGISPVVFLIVGSFLIITWAFVVLLSPIQNQYTGEIIKFYANGTVLVDNGTVMPWPCGGCGK